jgi:hypothetical protein
MILYIVGFRSIGKTKIGKILSEKIGFTYIIRKYFLLLNIFLISFLITACHRISKNNIQQKDNLSGEYTNDAKSNNNISDYDTITNDYTDFPIDSSLNTKVLTVGTFHSDEVGKNANKENWIGLFQSKTSFYLADTKIKTIRVYDPIADENEKDKTGWEVSTTNSEHAIILIEALDFLKPHQVIEAVLSKKQIFPGDTLQINYLGVNYILYATGEKKKVQADPEWFEVRNYKLYITATIKGKQHKSLLVAKPNFDDQMITLIFAGDIDGDGILDLIINNSRHYNVSSPTIYFSKPAQNREVVIPFGVHTSLGC